MASRTAGFVSAGVLAIHLAVAVVALWLLPRGFASDDIHFWSNTIVPAGASLAVVAAFVVAGVRRSAVLVRLLAAAAAGGWTAATVLGAILFPVSMTFARLAIPALVALGLLALAWWARQRTVWSVVALAVGAGLGGVVIVAQRAPTPSTHPAGGPPRAAGEGALAEITAPCGQRQIHVNPLLAFISRSPDRTWTLLAPAPWLAGQEQRSLAVRRDADGTSVELEAITTLPEPVYSHLNSFTSIEIPYEASVSFGPTGATRFPIEPADYPSGRPIRLAYLDAQLGFHVALADDAEKGPFHELATGRLARGEALTLELRPRDGSDAGCRITFQDWSAQVSTQPSPTAGWGVPQGSIQFFSGGEGLVLLTLADTGPGRGFDSVGHAAGTYRNRVRIEAIR